MKLKVTWAEFVSAALNDLEIKQQITLEKEEIDFLTVDDRGIVSDCYTLPEIVEIDIKQE